MLISPAANLFLPGEVLCLAGENGSGKSTLISSTIAGSGRIRAPAKYGVRFRWCGPENVRIERGEHVLKANP
jgi:ABC-type phosphonate transport system ATPase subunit